MRELRRVIVLFAAAVCLLSGCGAGVRPEGASGQGKQDVTIILKAPAQDQREHLYDAVSDDAEHPDLQ